MEDLARMKAAGFGGVFCNIGDASGPESWGSQRQQARDQGMFCGPWLRTANAHNEFDPNRLQLLLDTADAWGSPLIVNCEKEIDFTDDDLTSYIATEVAEREAAISMEQMPFGAVDWKPLSHLPVLPQVFPAETGRGETTEQIREAWWNAGMQCVYMTFGSYAGKYGDPDASWYVLDAPYSIYTGDDCGYDYAAWSPASHSYEGCRGIPPPDGGDDMQTIGNQDGITASMNRLRELDPLGTALVRGTDGKWPDISTLPPDMGKWKAYDKLQRTLQILKDDHDGSL